MLAVGSRLVFGLKLSLSGVLFKLVLGVLIIGMGFGLVWKVGELA